MPRLKARAQPFQRGSSFSGMDYGYQSVEGGILSYLEGKLLANISKEYLV